MGSTPGALPLAAATKWVLKAGGCVQAESSW
jgi:hypothetical protein